jgi:hypothetical protein
MTKKEFVEKLHKISVSEEQIQEYIRVHKKLKKTIPDLTYVKTFELIDKIEKEPEEGLSV